MSKISYPEAIFFDVDGVLIDSLTIKGDAFSHAFSDYPDAHDEVVSFHRAHGGVNRSEKIAALHLLIVGRAPTERELADRITSFAVAVVRGVMDAPEIPGAGTAIAEWFEKSTLYAVSATPTDELRSIFDRRDLTQYFRCILGWPPDKGLSIQEVITTQGHLPSSCILVGDSLEDLQAAISTGVQFIQVCPPSAPKFVESNAVIENLHDLSNAIRLVMKKSPQ
ncbi:HAD hydrolase-like protein [Actinomycetota bacterium]|jgi:phosphoglycolate phosphatase-like HAD superfamily hydrolase|nr:HAD hydrolase-like protein [Actinomycetota bacterium]